MFKLKLMLRYTIAFTCLLIIHQGCTSSSNWEKVHPDFDRLPSDEDVDYTTDISGLNDVPLPYFFHPDSLQYRAVIGIGNDSTFADENYYYGTPQKMDIDPSGNIYIAQKHTNSINVYDSNGKFTYTIGNGGKGPGEFLRLITFAFDSDYQKLYAVDALEIEIFELNEDRYEYTTTVPHSLVRPYDVCVLGSELFISGYKIKDEDMKSRKSETSYDIEAMVSPPITRIDPETFEHTLSFGYEYKSYSGFGTYDGILSETLLSCNEQTNTIVGYLKHFPYIFGYDRSGHQKWISKIDNYISTKFIEWKKPEHVNPGLIAHANERLLNFKYPIQKIYHKEYSLLQFGWAKPQPYYASSGTLQIKPDYRTILVDTYTGELFYSNAYPVIGTWRDEVVITIDMEEDYKQSTFQINEYR